MTENVKRESKLAQKLMMHITDSRYNNEEDDEEIVAINELSIKKKPEFETKEPEKKISEYRLVDEDGSETASEDFIDLSIIYPEKKEESFISVVRRIIEVKNPYNITFNDEVKEFIKDLLICNHLLFKEMEKLFVELYTTKENIETSEKVKKLMTFLGYFYNYCFQFKILPNEKLADLCGESFKAFINIYIFENSAKIKSLTDENFDEISDFTDIIIGLIKLNTVLENKYNKPHVKCFKKVKNFFKLCADLAKYYCCKK